MGDGADRKLGWQGEDGGSYEAGMLRDPCQSRANHGHERDLLASVQLERLSPSVVSLVPLCFSITRRLSCDFSERSVTVEFSSKLLGSSLGRYLTYRFGGSIGLLCMVSRWRYDINTGTAECLVKRIRVLLMHRICWYSPRSIETGFEALTLRVVLI